jgi:hypothetical protein
MAGGRIVGKGVATSAVGVPPDGQVSRRMMLRWSGTAGMMAVGAMVTQACVPVGPAAPGQDANGVVLLPGFSSRIIATAGERVPGTGSSTGRSPTGQRPSSTPRCRAGGT